MNPGVREKELLLEFLHLLEACRIPLSEDSEGVYLVIAYGWVEGNIIEFKRARAESACLWLR